MASFSPLTNLGAVTAADPAALRSVLLTPPEYCATCAD